MIPPVERGKLITADRQNALIEQLNSNTSDIAYLMTTGGGGPNDPFVNWYVGDVDPPVPIQGAKRGDLYVNRATGELFQLH